MPTTPTTDAIPSLAPVDLLYNAEQLDRFINATADTFSDRFGVSRLTLEGARNRLYAVAGGDRVDPTRNGLIDSATQFRGATDTAASLGGLAAIVNADTNTAASDGFIASDVDYLSTVNGASDAGAVVVIGPAASAIVRVHIAQPGLAGPYSVNASGAILAASAQMLRLDFAVEDDVRYVEIRESAPTEFDGTPGTGSARLVTVTGIKAAAE